MTIQQSKPKPVKELADGFEPFEGRACGKKGKLHLSSLRDRNATVSVMQANGVDVSQTKTKLVHIQKRVRGEVDLTQPIGPEISHDTAPKWPLRCTLP